MKTYAPYIIAWPVIALLATLLSALTFGAPPDAATPGFPAGTVIVSRNVNEADNTSPGYWNHLGMSNGRGFIIEAQEGKGVIFTPLREYINRPYHMTVLRPRDVEQGRKAAQIAAGFVGEKYNKLASLGLQGPKEDLKLGQNCVSVVRRAEEQSTGKQYTGFNKPDDVFDLKELFTQ